jgi:hypothetical protein
VAITLYYRLPLYKQSFSGSDVAKDARRYGNALPIKLSSLAGSRAGDQLLEVYAISVDAKRSTRASECRSVDSTTTLQAIPYNTKLEQAA